MTRPNSYPRALSRRSAKVKAKIAKRRKQLKETVLGLRRGEFKGLKMGNSRGFEFAQAMFRCAGIPSLKKLILDKTERGRCIIFEIGPGSGGFKSTMALHAELNRRSSKIEILGLDIFPTKKTSRHTGYSHGNVISKPFPKSDVIYSAWTLGYVGHFGFMLHKIAKALNSGGIAVVQINSTGPNGEAIIKNPRQLRTNIEQLGHPGCKITTHDYADDYGPIEQGFIVRIEKE